MRNKLTPALNGYKGNATGCTSVMDKIQNHFKCCGIKNSSDWTDLEDTSPWKVFLNDEGLSTGDYFPQSCCNDPQGISQPWWQIIVNNIFLLFNYNFLILINFQKIACVILQTKTTQRVAGRQSERQFWIKTRTT